MVNHRRGAKVLQRSGDNTSMMEQDYWDRYPGRAAFMALIDLEHREELFNNGNRTCYEVVIGGLIRVAMCIVGKRMYLRAKDFTVSGESFPQDPKLLEEATQRVLRGGKAKPDDPGKSVQQDINSFVARMSDANRKSRPGRKIVDTFREEVQDAECDPSVQMRGNHGHTNRRTDSQFVAVELLPHFLSYHEFYESPPVPSWMPIWEVIQKMELLKDCPLDVPRTRKGGPKVNRKQRVGVRVVKKVPETQEQVHEEIKGEEDLSDERLKQLRTPDLWAIIRNKSKLIEHLRNQNKKQVKNAPAEEVMKAQRNTISKLQYKLSQALVDLGKVTQIERMEIQNQQIIKILTDSVDFKKEEVPREVLKSLTSYRKLFDGLTPEQVVAKTRDREYFLHAGVRAVMLIRAELDRVSGILRGLDIEIGRKEIGIQTDETCQSIDAALQITKNVQERLQVQSHQDRVAHTPSLKGREAEDRLLELLVGMAPTNVTVLLTRSTGRCGDFVLLYKEEDVIVGYAIIDCKSYSHSVPEKEVQKLVRDIDACTRTFLSPPRWAAIVSVESDIIHNGHSRADDFCHGTTPVFLMHSTNSHGDNGTSSIHDMFSKSRFYASLVPPVTPSEESVAELNDLEITHADKRSGRGRSHSKMRSDRVKFGEVVVNRVETLPVQTPEPPVSETSSISEDNMAVLANLKRGSRSKARTAVTETVSQKDLDKRIFVTDAPRKDGDILIAAAMSRLYKYKKGENIKGTILIKAVVDVTKLSESRVSSGLRNMFQPGVRDGQTLTNLCPV